MKCHVHYNDDAVSQCSDCGKGLCLDCTNKYNIPLCNTCATSRNSAIKQLWIKNSILMAILFIIGFVISTDANNGFFQSIFVGYAVAGIPWGWSALDKITPNVFLILPLIGWVIYFVCKLLISLFVGMFVAPYKIYQIVKGLKKAKQLENYIKT